MHAAQIKVTARQSQHHLEMGVGERRSVFQRKTSNRSQSKPKGAKKEIQEKPNIL